MTSTARIELYLPAETKAHIERAAAIEGISVSAFIVANAHHAAKQVIAEHEALMLRQAEQKAFVQAILRDVK